jgi:hypothetical protein
MTFNAEGATGKGNVSACRRLQSVINFIETS